MRNTHVEPKFSGHPPKPDMDIDVQANPDIRPPSYAPASRWRQGQALRVLRNLDPAGRGRSFGLAGSEGMTAFLPHQGN